MLLCYLLIITHPMYVVMLPVHKGCYIHRYDIPSHPAYCRIHTPHSETMDSLQKANRFGLYK